MPGLRPFVNRPADGDPAYYKLGFQFDATALRPVRGSCSWRRCAEGIAVDEGFRALHAGRSPSRCRKAEELTEADRAHTGAVVLHHPVLLGQPEEIEEVARAVDRVQHGAQDRPGFRVGRPGFRRLQPGLYSVNRSRSVLRSCYACE